MSQEKSKKIIFKDELCDVTWQKKSLTCQKGTLKFTGQNKEDFMLYNAWCKSCDKIRIVDRKDFTKQFKNFIKAVDRTLEED
jgi:hypothetical protein